MNIYDISKKAGVSIATVSRVLNGNTNVSEKTRKKVEAVMEETGYTPNVFARGLGLDSMKTIGILCADSSDSFLASAIYYIEQELRQFHYDVILCCTGYELSTKQKYLELLLSKRVDAVILVGSNFVEQSKAKNKYIIEAAKRVPVIILNGHLDAANIYSSMCDDADAMYKVTKNFLNHGKRKILYLYRSLSYSGLKKLEGFKKAFEEQGIPLEEEQICLFNGTIEETRNMLMEVYKKGKRYEAILTSDDELAIGAIKFAKACHLAIPEELSIVGYNNSKLGICCEPELTTVDNKLVFSCMNAVTTLMNVLNGSEVPAKTMISADVKIRNTTNVSFDN
ncbi:MAG: LacI family DNA-binding transcriptional regulator [Lachnospiraceae bacterium]|nr:LacI family DNA-binding transcriptional regulator [Lachnospiraceae bacterium]